MFRKLAAAWTLATFLFVAPVFGQTLTNAGVDRMLDAITCVGESAANPYWALHTGSPSTSNQLSGNGYAAVHASGTWDLSSPTTGVRRIASPAVTFGPPTAAWSDPTHLGLWVGGAPGTGTLVWSLPISVDAPQTGASVTIADDAVFIELDRTYTGGTDDWELSEDGADDALQALTGSTAVASCTDRWALHTAHPTNSTPAEITGTAYDDIAAAAWVSSATITSGFRGRYAGAVDWSDPTANWDDPTHMGLWNGVPGDSGVQVLVVWDISVPQPLSGGEVDIEANTVYIEFQLAGTAQ